MWIVSLLVAFVVTGVTLLYAAFLPQISGESLQGWFELGVIVFIPWLVLTVLFQRIRRIKHLGAARLFQLVAFASAAYGVATSHAMDVPTAAAYFAAYGSLALALSAAIWWVVQGFSARSGK